MRRRQRKANTLYTTDTTVKPKSGLPQRRAPGPVTLRWPTLKSQSPVLSRAQQSTSRRVPDITSAGSPTGAQGRRGHHDNRLCELPVRRPGHLRQTLAVGPHVANFGRTTDKYDECQPNFLRGDQRFRKEVHLLWY